MALIGSLSKPLMNSRGPLGQLFEIGMHGFGGAAVVNVADKELLGGKLTSIGVNLPFNLGATPVRLNLTDGVFWLLVNGASLRKGSLIKSAIKLGLKKVAESRGWVDPPSPANSGYSVQPIEQPIAYIPTSGGLTHS